MGEKSIFEKIKEAGSHSIIYGLGSSLQALLGFLLIPLYTHYFTTDFYGALSLINLCGTVASTVFYLGASSALARSYYDYDDEAERKKVASTSLYIASFGALLQVVLGVLLSGVISTYLFKDARFALHISLVLVSMAFWIINSLLFMLLRFKRMSKQVVILNVGTLLVSCSLIFIFLVKLKLGLLSPILGNLVSQATLFCVLLYLVRHSLVLDYSQRELKVQLSFGIQTVVAGIAYSVLDWLNRLFINKYCSLGDVGVYALGNQIATVVTILLVVPFCQIWSPMRMQYRKDANADQFYAKIVTYFLLAGFTIVVMISLFSREIITLVSARKEYVEACRVVPFLITGLMLFGVTYVVDHGIYFARKVIYYSTIYLAGALVCLLLNYVFVPRFGYLAASVNILICYALILAMVFLVSNRMYRTPYEGRRVLITTTVSVAALVTGLLLQGYGMIVTLLYKGFVVCTMFAIIYFMVLSLPEREAIANLIEGVQFWKRRALKA